MRLEPRCIAICFADAPSAAQHHYSSSAPDDALRPKHAHVLSAIGFVFGTVAAR